jgi:hypothetical protein
MILPVVLYGCETQSLALRGECTTKVFRRIFWLKSDEETRKWRKLHLSSPKIVRVIRSRGMRLAGHVARMGKRRGVYRVLVGKPEGKRPLGRTRRRWVDNIKMDVQEVGCGGMDGIELVENRDKWQIFVNAVMNLRIP